MESRRLGQYPDGLEFNQTPVGRPVRGHIETNRWYDVKIELSGKQIRCFLDGELIHDASATAPETFFTVAGRETATGDVLIKTINLGAIPVTAQINLSGISPAAEGHRLTVLTSGNLADNNSLNEPRRVVPNERVIGVMSGSFPHEFPARSLSVLRLKTR